ncbi:MAG: NAD-dependent epimerase/dehydratase family protein, partial [Bacteroidota bacterium]
ANAAPRYLATLRSLYGLDRIQRIVFTSSTGVYGEQEGELTELSPRQPNTHSARAVVAAENWLQEHEERVSILRLAGLIGPERHPGNFYGGKQRPIPNGDAPVNLVHRDDVISAIRLDLAQPAPGLYNVCAVAHPPKGEYYTAAARLLGRKIAGVQAGGKNAKVILSERLRDRGWRPVYDDLALSLPE